MELWTVFEFKKIDYIMFSGGWDLNEGDALLFVFCGNTSKLCVKSDRLPFILQQIWTHLLKWIINTVDYLHILLTNSVFLELQIVRVWILNLLRSNIFYYQFWTVKSVLFIQRVWYLLEFTIFYLRVLQVDYIVSL